jgi:hypothetical protein
VRPQTLEPNAQRLKRREVTQMSKTKKLIASALAIVALAAIPSTGIALSGSAESVQLACGGGAGGGCAG